MESFITGAKFANCSSILGNRSRTARTLSRLDRQSWAKGPTGPRPACWAPFPQVRRTVRLPGGLQLNRPKNREDSNAGPYCRLLTRESSQRHGFPERRAEFGLGCALPTNSCITGAPPLLKRELPYLVTMQPQIPHRAL